MAALDQASLWLLYFVCFAMPLTGHLMSGNGKPVSYFGLFLVLGFPRAKRSTSSPTRFISRGSGWSMRWFCCTSALPPGMSRSGATGCCRACCRAVRTRRHLS